MRPSSHTAACHLATDAGKEISNKVGFVYQLNISPKKMGVDEEIFVVDLKKGAVSTGKYEGTPDASFTFTDDRLPPRGACRSASKELETLDTKPFLSFLML
ncbi:Peroxisomal multifunctional enzyme type 2 [Hordeum vulgare]|nr:Peroxisomal multifunctional enzyme type 2 [Hordeum vulgare]